MRLSRFPEGNGRAGAVNPPYLAARGHSRGVTGQPLADQSLDTALDDVSALDCKTVSEARSKTMARLSEIVVDFAEVLKVPEKSVRHAASVLRLHKLITSGPRGPGAPHMTATDAANLLLALMYDDDYEAAKINVPRLREAQLVSFGGRTVEGLKLPRELPAFPFLGSPAKPYFLGAVLDELLAFYAGGSEPKTPVPHIAEVVLSISRPGHVARLHVDVDQEHWTFAYERRDRREIARREKMAALGERPVHYLDTLGTYLLSTRSIQGAELSALAACLGEVPRD